RSDLFDFPAQPYVAGFDLALSRRLVHAPPPAHLEAEVLDRIGDEDRCGVDAHLAQQVTQEFPRGADERMSRLVLVVARSLADEHQARAARPFADDRLRSP